MKDLSSETCLIPTPEGESRPIANSFGFTTECFFLTHRALDLGYRVILDKFLRYEEKINSVIFLNSLIILQDISSFLIL